MTFSSEAKLELARLLPTMRCCALAELAAILRVEGVTVGPQESRGGAYEVALGYPAAARKVYLLLKGIGIDAAASVDRNHRRPQRRGYRVWIPPASGHLVEAIAVSVDTDLFGDASPQRRCCRRAYLRGAFLCRGSLSAPEKTYHFEIVVDRLSVADSLVSCLQGLGLSGRISRRKGAYVVYLKESEGIVDALSLMGAHGALLKLENVRIVKGMRNQVNRLVNCETANVDKTVKAAVAQLDAIKTIQETDGLRSLPGPLGALARARLEHPYASFRELGEMLSPKVSKSGVNYRMTRLLEYARGMKEEARERLEKEIGVTEWKSV